MVELQVQLYHSQLISSSCNNDCFLHVAHYKNIHNGLLVGITTLTSIELLKPFKEKGFHIKFSKR